MGASFAALARAFVAERLSRWPVESMKTSTVVGLWFLMMSQRAIGASTEVAPIGDPDANVLGQITGIHSVQHRRSKLEARLLEADGAASVARDPISSGHEQRDFGSAGARLAAATDCGPRSHSLRDDLWHRRPRRRRWRR